MPKKKGAVVTVAEPVSEPVKVPAKPAPPEPWELDPLYFYRYSPDKVEYSPSPFEGKRTCTHVYTTGVRRKKRKLHISDMVSVVDNKPKRKPEISESARLSNASNMSVKGKSKMKISHYEYLNDEIVTAKPLSTWISPGELPLIPPPLEVLHKQKPVSKTLELQLKAIALKESRLLRRNRLLKAEQLNTERYLMEKTGKDRGELLIRRSQLLPNLEPPRNERTYLVKERTLTPAKGEYPKPDLDLVKAQNLSEKRGITFSLTRKERGFKVYNEWHGCPEVTDEMREILQLCNSRYIESIASVPNKTENQDLDNFIPDFKGLGLVGSDYRLVQKEIYDLQKTKKKKLKPAIHATDNYHEKSIGSVGETPEFLLRRKNMKARSMDDSSSFVSLRFHDRELLYQSPDTKEKEPVIVEIGCTAEHREHALTSITMKNTGTSLIRYNWIRMNRNDTFKLNRYETLRFVFDSWGGSILPGETFRVPILYRGIEQGYFSEDWQLITKPKLENGTPVIMRMWGMTRKFDPLYNAREIIEKTLEKRMTLSLVEHRVQKIIDYLPLKEVPLKDTRFPLLHEGQDLFELNNPWLKYQFPSVFRLTMLWYMTEKRRLSRMETLENSFDFFSDSYSDSEEVTEEANSGETSVVDLPDTLEQNHYMFKDRSDRFCAAYISRFEEKSRTESPSKLEKVEPKLNKLSAGGSMLEELEEVNTEPYSQTVVNEKDHFQQAYRLDRADSLLSNKTGSLSFIINSIISRLRKRINIDEIAIETILEDVDNETKAAMLERAQETHMEKTKNVVRKSTQMEEEVASIRLPPEPPSIPINLCDPNFVVDDLRENILMEPTGEVQEAMLTVLNEELETLAFSGFQAKEDWKQSVTRGLLSTAIDNFSCFAETLKNQCIEGEVQLHNLEMRQIITTEIDSVDSTETMEEEEEDLPTDYVDTKSIKPATVKETQPSSTQKGSEADQESQKSTKSENNEIPSMTVNNEKQTDDLRQAMGRVRYQDSYYNRLHTRMYEVLGGVADAMDDLLIEKRLLKLDLAEMTFTKVKSIPMSENVTEMLDAPLPPTWVQIAQNMANVQFAISQRREEIESRRRHMKEDDVLRLNQRKGSIMDRSSATKAKK